ncbi:uncharacterized protein NECHADRAFT_77796 [Fusarium vanettenii 77-13-4]|uniref:Uncharacterized protein n=1 Tax=Fusarium vanettenii (strain ATCC MYA-4622 / CBS 123669 / FGSC 9596 / NRRL 45880 / 77-13-4) TaxID=660122 RepID=C7YM89_FUSV7|nr:uncharacterized protein NECHADRAFT_77796 [Fusarium vanettenii 77-13-4]EEU47410.1 predicted protein [Fusarium vanettenii 77-13-4]
MNTTNNGTDIIGDCVKLINEALPIMSMTHPGYPYVQVKPCGDTILARNDMPHVSLFATSLTQGIVYVNMNLPGIQRTLKELAESGAPWTDFQAVRYEFVTIEPNSTTVYPSLPVSTIPASTIPVPAIPNSMNFLNSVSVNGSLAQETPEQK